MGPWRQWLKILRVVRGYWGTDLFCELNQGYGIDCVSRVRDDKREIHEVIEREIGQPQRVWSQPLGGAGVLREKTKAAGADNGVAFPIAGQRPDGAND